MRKIFVCILLICFVLKNLFVYSESLLQEQFLYYTDKDFNGKIDNIEIEFNNELTGSINKEKIFLYSNTGGLSTQKLDSISGNSFINDFYLSGNILGINLIEQDNYLTGLTINNTTSSDLRLKTNSGVGIKDIYGNEIKFLYTSSFGSYTNVNYRNYTLNSTENSNTGVTLEETNTGTLYQENDENTNTGEVIESNSGGILDENISNSGSLEEGNTNTGNILDEGFGTGVLENTSSGELTQNSFSGNIKIVFQSPSYLLETDLEKENYNCDTSKTDCKVNYNTNIDEGNGFETIGTKYICEWDFGFGETTGEEGKCNPNTITYPIGEFETKLKVSEKSNTGNYLEKNIKIKNEGYKEIKSSRVVYLTNTYSNNIYIEPPSIKIQSGLDDKNNCKSSDCKINFIYEPKNSKESCFWNFSGGEYEDGSQNKCNPAYVKYGTGSFKVVLRVYEDGNTSNFKESEFYFTNVIQKNILESEIKTNFEVKSIISLQGKVGDNKVLSGNTLTCFGDCGVNFDGSESIGKDLKYIWDFGNGDTFKEKNPASIDYKTGYYQVKLKVLDEYGNEDESDFYINVLQKEENVIENTENISENVDFSKYEGLKIIKVLSNPIGSEEFEFIEVKNEGKEKINLFGCSLDDEIGAGSKVYNFSENEEILGEESKKYFKYDTNISLKNTGREEVNLVCFGKQIDSFGVKFSYPEGFVLSKDFQDIQEVKKVKNSSKFEIIFTNGEKKIVSQDEKLGIFEEILKKDLDKEEKIKKVKDIANRTFSQKISKQKSGIKIYGNFIPNSEIILKLEEKNLEISFLNFFINKTYAENDVFETKTDKNGNYEIFLKNPNIGEFDVKTYLKVGAENVLELDKINSFEVDNDYLDYLKSSNKRAKIYEYIKPKSVIILQGKLGENKKVSGNKITCFDTENCSINFDGRKSEGKNIKYLWNFGNLEKFEKSNPSSFKFPFGNHIVSLKVSDGNEENSSYFIVEVLGKESEKQVNNTLQKTKDIFIKTANASNNEDITISFSKDIFYIILTFLLFLVLFVLILRKKGIF